MSKFIPVYIFDLDGTVCNHEHRLHFLFAGKEEQFHAACVHDTPVLSILGILKVLYQSGAEIWFVSGRSRAMFAETLHWLATHTDIPREEIEPRLFLRPARDWRQDTVVKGEWLRKQGPEFKARVAAVFEDRSSVVKMWRDNGLTCLQVAEGDF